VIFGADDGTIGAGCIRELADAIALGVPIAGFDLGRGLREISGFDLIDTGRRNPRRTATKQLGGCVEGGGMGPRVPAGGCPMTGATVFRPADQRAAPRWLARIEPDAEGHFLWPGLVD
jgi:hypothetical protein